MQDYDGPKSPAPVKTATIVMVLMATTMIGASSGILIADRDGLLLVERTLASQLASFRGFLLPSAKAANVKPETPDIIPIELSSVTAIHYSSKPDSTHIAFDLKAMDLIRTGKLRSPDRIYFDLQDRSREGGTLRQLKTQKAVNIAGNLLTRIRISQRKQGAMRIVLDLTRSCDFTYQTLIGSPSRLMAEIRPRLTGASASE